MTGSETHQRAMKKMQAIKARKRRVVAARALNVADESAEPVASTISTTDIKEEVEAPASEPSLSEPALVSEPKEFTEESSDVLLGEALEAPSDILEDEAMPTPAQTEEEETPASSAEPSLDENKVVDEAVSTAVSETESVSKMSTDDLKENNVPPKAKPVKVSEEEECYDEQRDKVDELPKTQSKASKKQSSRRRHKSSKKKRVRIRDDDSTDSRNEFFRADAVTDALDHVFDLFNPLGDDLPDDESSIRTERTEDTEGPGAFLRNGLLQDVEELFMEKFGCAAPTTGDLGVRSFSFPDDAPTVETAEDASRSTYRDGSLDDGSPARSIRSSDYAKRIRGPSNTFESSHVDSPEEVPQTKWDEVVEIVENFLDPKLGKEKKDQFHDVVESMKEQASKVQKDLRRDLNFQKLQTSFRETSSMAATMMKSVRGKSVVPETTVEEKKDDPAPTEEMNIEEGVELTEQDLVRVPSDETQSVHMSEDVTPEEILRTLSEDTRSIHMPEGTTDEVVGATAPHSVIDELQSTFESTNVTAGDDAEVTGVESEENNNVTPGDESQVPDLDSKNVVELQEEEEAVELTTKDEPLVADEPLGEVQDVEVAASTEEETAVVQPKEIPQPTVVSVSETATETKLAKDTMQHKDLAKSNAPPQSKAYDGVKHTKKKGKLRGISKLIKPIFKRKKSKATAKSIPEASEAAKPLSTLMDPEESGTATLDFDKNLAKEQNSTPERDLKPENLSSTPATDASSPSSDAEGKKTEESAEEASFDVIMTTKAQDDDWNDLSPMKPKNIFDSEDKAVHPSDSTGDTLSANKTSQYQDMAHLITDSNNHSPEFLSNVAQHEQGNVYSASASTWEKSQDDDNWFSTDFQQMAADAVVIEDQTQAVKIEVQTLS